MALEWSLYSLELDGGAEEIGSYFQKRGYSIKRAVPQEVSRGEYATIIEKSEIERIVRSSIESNGKNLVLYGDGNCHHFTYGLCRLADKISDEYCYIHIDHHFDAYGDPNKNNLNCANFVGQILSDCHVYSKNTRGHKFYAIFIGSMPDARFMNSFSLSCDNAFNERELKKSTKRLELILGNMPDDAYVTMDLDVMAESEIYTEYQSHKGMLKRNLLDILGIIKSRKRIIGADVLGYTHRNQGHMNIGAFKRWKSKRLYKAIVDRIMGE